jgi:hypothetical protein
VVDEQLEALGGQSGEQAGLVAEVVGGRGVGHADAAGDVAQAEVVRAELVEGLRGGVEQRPAQVPDEVFSDPAAITTRARHLDLRPSRRV